jgi:hypothetical protein
MQVLSQSKKNPVQLLADPLSLFFAKVWIYPASHDTAAVSSSPNLSG